MKLLVLYYMISVIAEPFTTLNFRSHVGVRRSFTVTANKPYRSLFRHLSYKSRSSSKYSCNQRKAAATEFLVGKPHYKLEDGPLSISIDNYGHVETQTVQTAQSVQTECYFFLLVP